MATKKYQIFISSTFSDLIEERQLALKAILDLDQIPAGMEVFPAIDMDQFEYIKKVIDECDYYLLIIGARYGSTDNNGVSYTEREYDYACSVRKTVIALIHNDTQNLPMKKFDADPSLKIKLDAFRDKMKAGRMVRYWDNHDKLVAAMMQAIIKAINTYPATGWIRGDAAASDEVMQRFMQLSVAYDELATQHKALISENSARLEGLASLSDIFVIRYSYAIRNARRSGELHNTWAEILKIVGPNLYSPSSPTMLKHNIKTYIHDKNITQSLISINAMDAETIKIHLSALGLLRIKVASAKSGGVAEFVSLTEKGKSELFNVMAIRGQADSHGSEAQLSE